MSSEGKAEFERLNAVWSSETRYLSSTTRIVGHPAFRAIVAMGPRVVPWIVEELKVAPGFLSFALDEILGDPPATAPGKIVDHAEAWVARLTRADPAP